MRNTRVNKQETKHGLWFDALTWLRFGGLFAAIVVVLGSSPFVGNISYPVMAEFGILAYFYYSYQQNGGGLKAVAVHGFLAWAGFGLLLYLPTFILAKIVLLACLAALTMFVGKRFLPNTSGPFFVIMIASLGGTVEMNSAAAASNWMYLGIGTFIGFTAACGVEFISRLWLHAAPNKPPSLMPQAQTNVLSSCYGVAIGLAYWANLCFPFHTYNWLTVSAAANLKADDTRQAIIRYLWYILGNIIGVLIIAIISALNPPAAVLLVITGLFLMAVAMVITINYALALALATPLAVFLFDLLHSSLDDKLFVVRLVSIAIGSIIGLIADIIIIQMLAQMRKNKSS
ncbi:FUSC family protein [Bartonella sp. LJL80]